MADRLHLHPKHREELEVLLREHLPDVEVWAYGSRVNGRSHDGSDLDLVLRGPDMTEIPYEQLEAFADAVRDSTIPFLVEARDWTRLPERFHHEIERDYVVLRHDAELLNCGSRGMTPGAEWTDCTLADACSDVDYGLTASASPNSGGPKFLRITDIVSGHIDWHTVPHVAANDHEVEKYRLDDGDIVIARTGASTGVSTYVQRPPEAVFASYLVRLRAKPDVDGRFLSYVMKSPQFLDFIASVLGDKSAQPNASATTMTAAPLRIPRDKAKQRAIAHILGTLDDKIELNRRMNETLEAMARTIFKDWFVDFGPTRAKMEGRAPYLPPDIWNLFPATLVDSPVGKIPDGWRRCYLSDCYSRAIGGVWGKGEPNDAAATPIVCLRGVDCDALCEGRKPHAPHRWVSAGQLDKRRIPEGSILVEASGSNCGRSLLWRAEYERLFEHAVSYSNFVARLDHTCSASETTVCWYRLRRAYDDETVHAYRAGTAFPNLDVDALLAELLIVLPSPAIADAFSNLCSASGRVRLIEETERLQALRDSLLPELISGRVQVDESRVPRRSALGS